MKNCYRHKKRENCSIRGCPCHSSPSQKGWEINFDREFYPDKNFLKGDYDAIKSFIRSLREADRKAVEEVIRQRMEEEVNTSLSKRKNGWDILIEVKEALNKVYN